MKQPDSIDHLLLETLRRNSRIPLAALGEKVHLSRNAVRQRIERLERDGYIRGYTILERVQGTTSSVSAYLMIQRADRLRGAEVIEFLRSFPEVVHCDVLTGNFDLVVRLVTADVERVQAIWQEIAKHPGVRDTTTAITLSTEIRRPIPD